jgi:hypothetical protein
MENLEFEIDKLLELQHTHPELIEIKESKLVRVNDMYNEDVDNSDYSDDYEDDEDDYDEDDDYEDDEGDEEETTFTRDSYGEEDIIMSRVDSSNGYNLGFKL